MQETWVRFLGWEDSLEEGMATHSSTPAWRIPWTEEPGGPQSMGSQRVGHDRATKQQTLIDLTQINESFGSLITFKMVLFIYWLRSGSSFLHGLFSSFTEWGLFSSCSAQASHRGGFHCCRARAQELRRTDLVALWHVGSSWIRDRTCVSCTGRQILYHWVTREARVFNNFWECKEVLRPKIREPLV